MALQVTVESLEDANLIVDGLLCHAGELEADGFNSMAKRARRIADALGDQLDKVVPVPSGHPRRSLVR